MEVADSDKHKLVKILNKLQPKKRFSIQAQFLKRHHDIYHNYKLNATLKIMVDYYAECHLY